MSRIYCINIRWIKTPHTMPAVERMDAAIQVAGDWVRFNGFTWLVWTNANAAYLTDLVRKVVPDPEDSVLIVAVDPSDWGGWAPGWVWNWMRSKQELSISARSNANALAPSSSPLASLLSPPQKR